MTHAPMPASLLAQLETLARVRHSESPQAIIARDEMERRLKLPKRPRLGPWYLRVVGSEAE